MAEVGIRERSRRNGWGWPPHGLQVLSWILILYLSVLQFGLIAPAFLSLITRIILLAIMALMIGFLIFVKIAVTSIDPADFAVEAKVRERPQPKFDRSQHQHVIQDDYYCNICEEIVHPSSKHCRQCNKCVLDFDHHCKWLNNCVGARNYKWFLIFVGMTVLTCACISLQSLVAFIIFFAQPDSLYRAKNSSLLLFGTSIPDGAWLGFLTSTFVISILITGLTMHLFAFHMRLLKRGVTTYNFIMDQKKKAATEDGDLNNAIPSGGSMNGLPPPPPPPSNGWMNGFKNKINSKPHPVPNESGYQNARPPSANRFQPQTIDGNYSTVPKLPPIANQRNVGQQGATASNPIKQTNQKPSIMRRPTTNGGPHVDPSDLPYVQIHNSASSSPTESLAGDPSTANWNKPKPANQYANNIMNPSQAREKRAQNKTSSIGVNTNGNDNYSGRTGPVKLPPIDSSPNIKQPRPTTSKKLYEPHFESVFMAEKELALPSIMVTNSDSDTLLEQSMNDIPLKAMRSASVDDDMGSTTETTVTTMSRSDSVTSTVPADIPPGSTVYITQGQFTVTKITTPPASAAPSRPEVGPPKYTSSGTGNQNPRKPIQFNEEARFVDKGVACGAPTTPSVSFLHRVPQPVFSEGYCSSGTVTSVLSSDEGTHNFSDRTIQASRASSSNTRRPFEAEFGDQKLKMKTVHRVHFRENIEELI